MERQEKNKWAFEMVLIDTQAHLSSQVAIFHEGVGERVEY